MPAFSNLESVIRTDVNNIKNEEYKKNILRFNQLAGISDIETSNEDMLNALIEEKGITDVLMMENLYAYTRGIRGISEIIKCNPFAGLLASVYSDLSCKYRELYKRSKNIEYIVNVLMTITFKDNANATYLAYDAAKYVLEYDEYCLSDDVLSFLESLNAHIDKYFQDSIRVSRTTAYDMIESSVYIVKGIRKGSVE